MTISNYKIPTRERREGARGQDPEPLVTYILQNQLRPEEVTQ